LIEETMEPTKRARSDWKSVRNRTYWKWQVARW